MKGVDLDNAASGVADQIAATPCVLAFMQNQWVRDPEQLRRILDRHDEDFRRRMIARLLFAGCVSGQRLKFAFGDLCNRIVWEEASREIGGKSNACPPADPAHIAACLETLRPRIVLTFGRTATNGLLQTLPFLSSPHDVHVISAPHPAARGTSVQSLLTQAAIDLRAVIRENAP